MRGSPLQTVSDRDKRYRNLCGGCYPDEKLKNDKALRKGAQLSLQLYTPLHFSVANFKCNAVYFIVHSLAGYVDAGLTKGGRAVYSVDGPAQATKEKASMTATQAMGFCLKAAKVAFSETLKALKLHYSTNLTTTEHVLVVWNPYNDSKPMCVMPLQMGCPPPLLVTFSFCMCFCAPFPPGNFQATIQACMTEASKS